MTEQMAQDAEKAYNEGTNEDIRKIIQELENNVLQEPYDPEMEEWSTLLPDLGNTRGRLSQYEQALHVYWVVKRLIAKAMEQVVDEMIEIAQGIPNLRREMKNLHVTIQMQDTRLEEIQTMLRKITNGQRKEEVKMEAMVD